MPATAARSVLALTLGLAIAGAGCAHAPAHRPAGSPADSGSTGTDGTSSEPAWSWQLPVTPFGDDTIVSRFGDLRDGGAREHEGIDILAPRGTPVRAPIAGVIVVSSDRSRAGNVVILRDFNDYVDLVFLHLDERSVKRGQRVRPGQQIGTVGTTGNAAGGPPHLHFEIHDFDGPVDPYPLLAAISRR